MTLDMLEILVNAIIRALKSVAEVDHYAGMLFIAIILGLGSAWAITSAIRDYSIGFFNKILF